MKVALGQINTTVGDFSGNAAKIIEYSRRAREAGAQLAIFPELSICGYPPRDIVEKPAFLAKNLETAQHIARETAGMAVICGLVTPAKAETGKSAMNSAALLRDGRVAFLQSKMLLPTYDVFDELRNFAPAASQELYELGGRQMALTICEDAWNDKHFWNRRLYGVDPIEELMKRGGKLLVNISASPFHCGKIELRRRMIEALAKRYNVAAILVNQVGGNDSLVFDGSSVAFAPGGRIVAMARSFAEDLVYFDTDELTGDRHPHIDGAIAGVYEALVMGVRDYVHKCGFHRVTLGLSGGIDSALTAAIAVDALGAENVFGVSMPGPYSSQGSIDDARELAQSLGIRFEIVRINDVYDSFVKVLQPLFKGREADATEENLQSRIRGMILMALSNKFGGLVLSTGNKSEIAVGYCTLYGDMVGGLAVISDVPKTMVYQLAHFVNGRKRVIPESTMEKPPSAELRPNQKDTDSLPPYEVLDRILEDYVEDNLTAEQIAHERGFDADLVRSIIRMVVRNEYKRGQMAPGLKVTQKAFGVGRRFPIAAKYEF